MLLYKKLEFKECLSYKNVSSDFRSWKIEFGDILFLGTNLSRMLRYVARKMCHYVVMYSSSRLKIFTVYHMVRIIEYFTLYTAICRVYDVKSASVVGGSKSFCVIINPCIVNRRLSRSNNLAVRRHENRVRRKQKQFTKRESSILINLFFSKVCYKIPR